MRTPPPSQPTTAPPTADPAFPAISYNDNGLSRRPKDARIVHMMLADMGVTAYQERVPQQLIDFAYRHTSSILQEALHFNTEVYNSSGIAAKQADVNAVTMGALRLAVSSRTHYQFNPGLAKEQLQEMAGEKNKIALPPVPTDGPIGLPNERFTFSGVGYGLRDEWESEGEEDVDNDNAVDKEHTMVDREQEGDEEEEDERMEDLFGESYGGSGGGGADGEEMEE